MTIKQLEKKLNEVKTIETTNNRNYRIIAHINGEMNQIEGKFNATKPEKRITQEQREKLEARYNKIIEIKKVLQSEMKEEEYTYMEIRSMESELRRLKEVKEAKEILKASGKLDLCKKILKKTISKSPYSYSTYFHNKNQEIGWGIKPEKSYRLADHWNWNDGNIVHCALNTGEPSQEKMICIQKNGVYETVTILTEDEYWAFHTMSRHTRIERGEQKCGTK